MPNANLVELETSLKDCLRYCERHPESDLARLYHKRLRFVHDQLHESIRESDRQHARWRAEERDHLVAWKQLAHVVRELQNRLRRYDAQDFPAQRILYWDQARLMALVDALRGYLEDHAQGLDFAQEELDRLARAVEKTQAEQQDETTALKAFERFVDLRREGISEAGNLLGEFRVAMRRVLGKKHADYTGIFWPYSIASDENVLF